MRTLMLCMAAMLAAPSAFGEEEKPGNMYCAGMYMELSAMEDALGRIGRHTRLLGWWLDRAVKAGEAKDLSSGLDDLNNKKKQQAELIKEYGLDAHSVCETTYTMNKSCFQDESQENAPGAKTPAQLKEYNISSCVFDTKGRFSF